MSHLDYIVLALYYNHARGGISACRSASYPRKSGEATKVGSLQAHRAKARRSQFLLFLSDQGWSQKGRQAGRVCQRHDCQGKKHPFFVLSTAVEWKLIEKNPLERVHFEAEPTAETLKFWTPGQCTAFLEYIEQPYQVTTKGHSRTDDTGLTYAVGDYTRTKKLQEQLKIFINLALFSGLRKGELLALEWSDIDFENDIVTVSKSVGYSKGAQFIKTPKTKHSFRKVTIPHFLTLRIKAMKTGRTRYRLSLGDYWQGGEWLVVCSGERQVDELQHPLSGVP